jgi:hypothetical protein
MARKRHGSRKHRGGAGAPNPSSYSSAASYGLAVNGTGDQQYARTFEGPGSGPGVYTGVQGQKAGGKRTRRKRGGFLGEIINQAIVPFTILGMQQTYRKKHRGGRKSRKHRR